MIVQIKGKLLDKKPACIVLDVNGLGYEVKIPITTFFKLGILGSEVTLFTHQVFREDAQNLYGFYDSFERDIFILLLKVNGVGPKLGLAILSNMSGLELIQVIELEDVNRLVSLPGVGKKTASRLLIDMRDKLKSLELGSLLHPQQSILEASGQKNSEASDRGVAVQEAIHALVSLGYKPQEASKVVLKVAAKENKTVEQLITEALKIFAVS